MNVQGVQKLPFDLQKIFHIQNESQFEDLALKTFHYQYDNNTVYRQYVQLIGTNVNSVQSIDSIPFLPISFFKTHHIKSFEGKANLLFESSGTTGQVRSKHPIWDPTVYQLSFFKGFERFYGHIEDYVILALLPNYMENEHSSLIYMVDHLIELSGNKDSGFFLNDHEALLKVIEKVKEDKKVMLIGVSYALMDLAEKYRPDLSSCIIMETGGMKGRRKEMTKQALHQYLKERFKVDAIHSEYGMTELLSQAYSQGNGLFQTPPWMKILLRRTNDPFEILTHGSGGINVIDLANIYSCSFIATEDLGKDSENGFEVIGRFDNSDIRGCNLLIE